MLIKIRCHITFVLLSFFTDALTYTERSRLASRTGGITTHKHRYHCLQSIPGTRQPDDTHPLIFVGRVSETPSHCVDGLVPYCSSRVWNAGGGSVEVERYNHEKATIDPTATTEEPLSSPTPAKGDAEDCVEPSQRLLQSPMDTTRGA